MKLLIFAVIADTCEFASLFIFSFLANVHHTHHIFTELTKWE